jgi:bifunctional DNA-binding transcriptional regulator/antitoxin component of YhaV-PrlF toxin-antitoxin module
MARVTSKYQVTVPKKIAEAYHICPGHDIDWVPAGGPQDRLAQFRLFDQATERLRERRRAPAAEERRHRGWKREDLCRRGRSR